MAILKSFAIIILYITIEIVEIKGNVLPVEKCSLSDSPCLVKEFQKAVPIFIKGIPELGTEVLDPMKFDQSFEVSGLKFTLTNATLEGLKGAVIEDVKFDLNKKRLEIDFRTDCIVRGHYVADGHILILPITGDGKMKFNMKNVAVKYFIDYTAIKNDPGKTSFKPEKYHFKFEVRDSASFHLTNLFNGNQVLSDIMLTFLNENWKQITTEFGTPMMDVTLKNTFKNIALFLEKQPINEIALMP